MFSLAFGLMLAAGVPGTPGVYGSPKPEPDPGPAPEPRYPDVAPEAVGIARPQAAPVTLPPKTARRRARKAAAAQRAAP